MCDATYRELWPLPIAAPILVTSVGTSSRAFPPLIAFHTPRGSNGSQGHCWCIRDRRGSHEPRKGKEFRQQNRGPDRLGQDRRKGRDPEKVSDTGPRYNCFFWNRQREHVLFVWDSLCSLAALVPLVHVLRLGQNGRCAVRVSRPNTIIALHYAACNTIVVLRTFRGSGRKNPRATRHARTFLFHAFDGIPSRLMWVYWHSS